MPKTSDFLQLKLSAEKYPKNYQTLRELLRYLREVKTRHSDLIVLHGKTLLEAYPSKLGDEVWAVREQVFLASLDLGNHTLAEDCLLLLRKQFSDSSRVKRLEGMLLESQERWDEADELYLCLLQEDPSDSLAQKRRVIIQKSQGNLPRAIELLNNYLKDFVADESAWGELAELYLSVMMFKQAAYSYEEVIIATPQNYYLYERYAEILYSTGGTDNIRVARKYYALAIELNPDAIRCLWGLLLCVSLTRSTKGQKDNKLIEWLNQKIAAIYQSQNPSMLPLINRTIQSLKTKND